MDNKHNTFLNIKNGNRSIKLRLGSINLMEKDELLLSIGREYNIIINQKIVLSYREIGQRDKVFDEILDLASYSLIEIDTNGFKVEETS